jgi:mRNA-degrading endonuclease RelE of RelBE toxin-antitoxin system
LVSRVDYSVRFEVDLETIPEGARQEIRRTMQQVADAVSTIPLSSPFWSSMKHSMLQLDVKGYRVVYRVDPTAHEIRVVEISPVQH